MKLTKIFAFAIAAATLTACSDDATYNTASDVTVEMEQAKISFKENKGIVEVPIAVIGETNAPVRVEVAVEPYGENPAVADEHYLVTEYSVNIGQGSTTGRIEIKTVDDTELNDNRQFKVTIIKAEGAEIGEQSSTIVTLVDNDSDPYDLLQGDTWVLSYTDIDGAEQADAMTISEYEEGVYEIGGFWGYSWMHVTAAYAIDDETGEGTITISLGENMSDPYYFNAGLSEYVYVYSGTTGNSMAGKIVGKFDKKNLNHIEFEETDVLALLAVGVSTGTVYGAFDRFYGLSLDRE